MEKWNIHFCLTYNRNKNINGKKNMYLEEDNKRSYPDCLLMIYQQMTACDFDKLDGSMLVLVLVLISRYAYSVDQLSRTTIIYTTYLLPTAVFPTLAPTTGVLDLEAVVCPPDTQLHIVYLKPTNTEDFARFNEMMMTGMTDILSDIS